MNDFVRKLSVSKYTANILGSSFLEKNLFALGIFSYVVVFFTGYYGVPYGWRFCKNLCKSSLFILYNNEKYLSVKSLISPLKRNLRQSIVSIGFLFTR